jgi:hypothetical protein
MPGLDPPPPLPLLDDHYITAGNKSAAGALPGSRGIRRVSSFISTGEQATEPDGFLQ